MNLQVSTMEYMSTAFQEANTNVHLKIEELRTTLSIVLNQKKSEEEMQHLSTRSKNDNVY